MAAIGTGLFDNDDAASFMDDLGERPAGKRAAVALGALDRVLIPSGYVDGPAMSEAIAAAATVGASMSPTLAADERSIPSWLVKEPLTVDEELVEKSRRTLRRALGGRDTEWWELWLEAGAVDDVRVGLQRSLGWLGDRDD